MWTDLSSVRVGARPSRQGGRRGRVGRASEREHGVGGARRGAAEVGGACRGASVQLGAGRARTSRAARSYQEHAAAAGDVQHAGRAARSAIVDERGREVAGVGRAADLVVDDGDLVALGGEPQHRGDEVLAVRRRTPRRCGRSRGSRRGLGDGDARRRAWSARRRRRGPVGSASTYGSVRVAVEDVVGRDVDDERAGRGGGRGEVAGAVAVDRASRPPRAPRRRRRRSRPRS